MTINKDHIGGMLFLVLSLAYGYYSRQIAMLPGDEDMAFNAQTMPSALAVVGTVLSIGLILSATRQRPDALTLNRFELFGYDFALVAKLLLSIVLFALALKWLGFAVSTTLFLISGYWLLGERRIGVLLLASIPFAIGFWLILVKLLDIYLAPGELFRVLFGG